MTDRRPALDRRQVLAHRRRTGGLDRRRPLAAASIGDAASAGLQDSSPRAAVMSLHARVEGIAPDGWAHPTLAQVWGPRYHTYAVPADAVAAFTSGRLPTGGAARRLAEDTADRLERFLDGRTMTYRAAGEGLGVNPNSLRYAAPTGRVRLRWEGSGPPLVWIVDPPEMSDQQARFDLVRRYLHVFGPDTIAGFAKWAGVPVRAARATFEALGDELVGVGTPIGPGWLPAEDAAAALESATDPPETVRLLPSGDAYCLRWGGDRELLVPDARHREQLWTSRAWPGAVLVDGEIVGTWRRSGPEVDITAWQPLTAGRHDAVDAEAAALPIGVEGAVITTHWREP